jgi:hypothetical protein
MKMEAVGSSKTLVPIPYTIQHLIPDDCFIYTLLLVRASVSFDTFARSWNVHSVPLIPSLRNQIPLIICSICNTMITLYTLSSFTQLKQIFLLRTSITDSTYSSINEDLKLKSFHLVEGSTMHNQQQTWQSMKDTASETSTECFHICFQHMNCFTFHRAD